MAVRFLPQQEESLTSWTDRMGAHFGVTTKTRAGDYALSTFDRKWHPIISEALRIRHSDQSSGQYRRRPLLRRRHALDFVAHVIDDANRRYG